jgi:predicted amidohydrolase
MEYFHVALLQLLPTDSQEGNQAKGLRYCEQAKRMGADFALFPEMWNIGYDLSPETISTGAIDESSEFISAYRELASQLDMAIGITYLEKYENAPRNTLLVIDRKGDFALTYAKVHTCLFDPGEAQLRPGDSFEVADLDTRIGKIRIGAMICYDREFPESARILMLKKAEILLVPNACPMEINRLSQLRARAYENMVGIATANYAAGMPDCNGHSSAFDGIVYRDGQSRDTLIVEAGEAENIYMADFPVDELRDYRAREVQGNSYRHPEKYQLLVEPDL